MWVGDIEDVNSSMNKGGEGGRDRQKGKRTENEREGRIKREVKVGHMIVTNG